MDKTESDPGVDFRALKNSFGIFNERRTNSDVSITVSRLETFNDNLCHLIATEGCTKRAQIVEVRKNVTRGS